MALVVLLAGCGWLGGPPERPTEVLVVQRGDTLFELARDHGYTVDQLRAWNGIDGDLIEVGQELVVYPDEAGAPAPAPAPRRAAPRPSSAPGLAMPPPKPCLSGPDPDGVGEAGMAASEGLSQDQAATALRGFVHHTLTCIGPDDAIPAAPLVLELVVGCDGQVDAVHATDPGGWPAGVVACVRDVLRHTPFPAHALPDGDRVVYPLRYTPP